MMIFFSKVEGYNHLWTLPSPFAKHGLEEVLIVDFSGMPPKIKR